MALLIQKDDTPTLNVDDVDVIVSRVDVTPLIKNGKPVVERMINVFGSKTIQDINANIAFDIHDRRVRDYLRNFGVSRMTKVNDTTRRELREALANGVEQGHSAAKMRKEIERVFAEAKGARARIIARTEVGRASNFGSYMAMDQAGVKKKEWLATADGSVRPTHAAMNGQIVAMDDFFTSGSGAKTRYPGDFGVAAEDVNCRCGILPNIAPDEKPKPKPVPDTPEPEAPEVVTPVAPPKPAVDPKVTEEAEIARQTSAFHQEVLEMQSRFDAEHAAAVRAREHYVNNTYYPKLRSLDPDDPERQAIKNEFYRLQEEVDKALEKKRGVTKEIHKRLYQFDTPTRFPNLQHAMTQMASGHASYTEKNLETAADFVGRVTGLKSVFINVVEERRASFSAQWMQNNLPKWGSTARTQVHELGHGVEWQLLDSDKARKAVEAYRKKLATSTKTVPMSTLMPGRGYEAGEMAFPGRYLHPYVGKVYRRGVTEVISMGLEEMFADPVNLATKDPDLFKLIYNLTRRRTYLYNPEGIGPS